MAMSGFTQTFPPRAEFTEKNLPDLAGKVYIVSGSNTGVGKELARILYSKNAKVYMAARSQEKAEKAIEDIKTAEPESKGSLVFLPLDLADLSTIKASVERFLKAETKLHVLFNNAGVMSPEKQLQKTAQGYEMHIGVNCLGNFLFTKLLTPTIIATAKTEPANTVRVIWVCSYATELFAVKNIGLPLDNLDFHNLIPGNDRYATSKVGNWAHGVEYAKRYKSEGIISIPLNPGNLTSELFRDQVFPFSWVARMLGYPPVNGAYTELFAGLSPDITLDTTGNWVIPFGRLYPIRDDLNNAIKTESEGGTGGTEKFWEWTEQQVKPYV